MIAALIILFVITVGLSARILEQTAAKPSGPATLFYPGTSAVSNGRHGPVQVVRFTLYDVGIVPREARARAGLVAISIEDLSGGSAGLVLTRDRDRRIPAGQVTRSANHWRGREEIHLAPGRYEVFDSSRPGNQATLIVEP